MESNPRALLVTNIPFESRGFGLKKLLETEYKTLCSSCGHPFSAPHIIIDKNIHNRVRNGACVMIFPTSTDACTALQGLQRRSTPVMYEGNALVFSFAAGKHRDHMFPNLPYEIRTTMELDPVATFSVTDQVSADRMAGAWRATLNPLFDKSAAHSPPIIVVDCMACIGGNTIGFSKHFPFVVAHECDSVRHGMLRRNVLDRLSIKNVDVPVDAQDCFRWIHQETHPESTCLFFDPPWGGPQYKEERRSSSTIPQEDNDVCSLIRDLIINTPKHVCSIALKIPSTDETNKGNTDDHNGGHAFHPFPLSSDSIAADVTNSTRTYPCENPALERHFPFRFSFGSTTCFVIVLFQPYFTNRTLDSVVQSINHWHVTQGHHEHRPEFFDFEKKRWIMLKKWKGSKIIV